MEYEPLGGAQLERFLTRARRVQDFRTRTQTRFIEYFRTRDPDPDPVVKKFQDPDPIKSKFKTRIRVHPTGSIPYLGN